MCSKTCPNCGFEKPPAEFSKDKRNKDGLQPRCKACNAVYRAAHKEELTAYGAAYRVEHRAVHAVYAAAHYVQNREKIATQHAVHHEVYPEKRTAAENLKKGNQHLEKHTNV